MKNFKAYIRENIRWLAVILFMALMMTVTMLLNGIPFKEIGYGLLLCIFVTAVAVFAGYGRHYESFRQLEQMRKNIAVNQNDMKTPEYMYERQYQDCINAIAQEKSRIQNEMISRQQDLLEYYSMWVHQIKTPIAALKLLMEEDMNAYLDAEDDADNHVAGDANNNTISNANMIDIEENDTRIINEKQKQQELFRIEQYVDMALQYMRLGAETNDFVIQKVMLDEVIKSSIHKYAKQFIHKKLCLTYEPQDIIAITDKKWLGFVIDQILSNAIKYTKQGGVTIQVLHASQMAAGAAGVEGVANATGEQPEFGTSKDHKPWYDREGIKPEESVSIIIEDTGIGIGADDLPRVYEKGYTGYNGHADKYSTGIGLYLCKAILDKLGHKLVIRSEKGKGTRAEIVI